MGAKQELIKKLNEQLYPFGFEISSGFGLHELRDSESKEIMLYGLNLYSLRILKEKYMVCEFNGGISGNNEKCCIIKLEKPLKKVMQSQYIATIGDSTFMIDSGETKSGKPKTSWIMFDIETNNKCQEITDFRAVSKFKDGSLKDYWTYEEKHECLLLVQIEPENGKKLIRIFNVTNQENVQWDSYIDIFDEDLKLNNISTNESLRVAIETVSFEWMI